MRIIIVFLFLCSTAFATTSKYRLVWRTNPATDMTIGWVQEDSKNAKVYYDMVDYGTDYTRYRQSHEVDRKVQYKWMDHRFSRLTDLHPNTIYYFVIVDDNSVSKRFSFKTAPSKDDVPLSIIAGGDSRNNQWSRQNANLLVSKLRPDAVFFGGDYTALDVFWEWETWLEDWQLTTAADGRMTPIVPTRGNHEVKNEDIYNIFDVVHPSVYYSLEIGGTLLKTFTLNSEISIAGDQALWLQTELESSEHFKHLIAQYHRPIRPHVSAKGEQDLMWKEWAWPFYNHGVDLVVECDAHTVKSTYPIIPDYEGEEGFTRNDSLGTVYVGEGCWGAPLRVNNDNKSWTRASGMFNQVKWIWVTAEKMEVRTIKTDNAFDVGTLTDNNRFSLPSAIELWEPESGSVVTIY